MQCEPRHCASDLATCGTDLTTCDGELATCATHLATRSAELAACEVDLALCTTINPAAPAPLLKTGQTASYGTGDDGDLEVGVPHGFVDNGYGTITDKRTGLMWEKKSDDGSIHDKDNTYTWGMSTEPYTMNGTVVTEFLAALNAGGGFAGYTDWRLPNLKELESLVNLEVAEPATFPVFNSSCEEGCSVLTWSCTAQGAHWSSSTYAIAPMSAWAVPFVNGSVFATVKSTSFHVRAVRGGS